MFTGIVTGVGRIAALRDLASSLPDGRSRGSGRYGKVVTVEAPFGFLDDVDLGDSIALNGACMTVTTVTPAQRSFTFDISAESLDKTVGLTAPGAVNLEKALRAHDRLGGHMVAGHVDGIGTVTHFAPVGESWELRVLAPLPLAKFLAYKGSLTVNGVSLTVNSISDSAAGCEVSVNLVPHTARNTALNTLRSGSRVNLEVDLIARYVDRMLAAIPQQPKANG